MSLAEELLVRTEELGNRKQLDFYREGYAPEKEALDEKLRILEEALATGRDDAVRKALKQVVPTYRSPEEVSARADQAEEMKLQKEPTAI